MNTGQEKQTKTTSRDFFCGPVIKTSPSNTGDAYLIPGQVAKILHAFWPHKKTKKTHHHHQQNLATMPVAAKTIITLK